MSNANRCAIQLFWSNPDNTGVKNIIIAGSTKNSKEKKEKKLAEKLQMDPVRLPEWTEFDTNLLINKMLEL
jgi:hypothetical protein